MKASFADVLAAWEEAKKTCTTREEFRRKWIAALVRFEWKREEFLDALDRHNTKNSMGS